MNDVQPLSQDEIQSLPRWARLALAARCVRRASSLVWAPEDQCNVIECAMALTEKAAASGSAGDDLADAAAAAYTLVLNTLDFAGPAPSAPEDEAAIITCIVAHAAAFAAEAATLAAPRMAGYLVAQSLSSALQAHLASDPTAANAVLAATRADWERLRDAVGRAGWDDQTPLPAGFFA